MITISDELLNKILDQRDFSTGGGSAAALAGSMAAALVAMVAELSIGRDYGLPDSEYKDVSVKAVLLRDNLYLGAEEDSKAFALVKKAYALPKETEPEKMDRQSSINKAFMQAAEVPLNNAMMCKQVLGLAQLIEGKSNLGAVSDLDVAINLANAAVSGCRANVEINLPSIKDRSKAEEIREALNTLF